MDNAWQSKCGFIWPSLTPSVVSSSQLRPPEPRNQMLNGGNQFYSHFVQGPNLAAHGSLHEPMFPCSSNLNFSSSDHVDRGNSYLSLLSGPPSLVQCDMKHFSLPKPFIAPSKVPNDNNNVVVSVPASGTSPAWDSLFTENTHNINLKVGQEFCRGTSPWKEGASLGGSSLHDVIRTVNINYQRLEQVKADCYQNAPNKDKAKDFSPQRSSRPGGNLPASIAKLISTNVLESQAVQLESSSSASHPSFNVATDCPRVYCSSTSGYLLLSNTGLLGVVCSCHGFHMSISKFSQHSGLCDVNPGDAVYVDNGETIAQWRKSYFCKFGIRIPEDHSGWDWPEGFSATTGLLKHCAAMSNVSNNSDLYGLIGYNGASLRSTQLWNIAVRPENPHQVQKLVNEVRNDEILRNGYDNNGSLFNGFISTSGNLYPVADNFVDCTTLGHSKMSKLVDPRGPERPISASMNSFSRGGNPFVSFPDLRKFESDGKESAVNGFGHPKEGKIVDREAGSSNIELRLGQPSPHGQVSGNSTLSALGSHLVEIHGDPQKSILPEQLIPNRNSREFQGCWQYLQSDQNISKSSARREQSQSTFADNVSKVDFSPQGEQFKGDAARGSVISMLLSPLKSPSEGNMHSKATNNVINGSHSMPWKCDMTFFPCNRDGGNEKLFNCSQLAPHQHIDNGREVGYASDALHVVINQHVDKGKEMGHSSDFLRFSTSLESPIQRGENKSILNGVVGASNDKSAHPCRFCGISADACNTRGCLKYPGKIYSHGFNLQADHALLRSAGLPTVSGHILPSTAVTQGPSALPISVPTLSPVSSTKESGGMSPLVDENMRLLAFKHVLDLSSQDHTTSTVRAKNQECSLIDKSWNEQMKRFHAGPLGSKGGQGPSVARKPDDSEFSVKSHQSGAAFLMASNGERSVSTEEVNKWSNFSRFLQGASLQSRDGEMQSGPSREPCQYELPSLRHGKILGSVTTIEQANSCLRGFPACLNGRCSCAVHTNCLHGERGSSSKTSFKKQDGDVDGRGSVALDLKVSKEQSGSVCQNESFEKTKQVELHAFQWRDVPGKVTRTCNVNLGDQPSDLFGGNQNVRDRIEPTAASCLNEPAQDGESMKEQEVSNISQASIEENNKDSCTVAVDDTRCIKNSVIDEGSGIEKCWSSDDALDSERSAEFLGFSCKRHSVHKGPTKEFPNQASRSLIEELRLIDSLRLKKLRGSLLNESSIHEKSHSTQKCDDCFKSGKRKRAMKAKTVDGSSTVPGLHSTDTESPKCKGSAERSCHSSTVRQKLPGPDQVISRDCTCSFMPAFKQRRFASLTAGTTIHKRNVQRLYSHEEAENYQTKLDVELQNLEKYEESGGKRFKLELAAPTVNKVSMHGKKAKVTRKPNSIDCVKNASKPIVHACKRKARPMVCGEYGAICSGDSLKPAKIVPLKKVLKAAKTCSLVEKKESRSGTAKELQGATNRGSYGYSDELYTCEEGKGRESESRVVGKYDYNSTEETEAACFPRNKSWDGLPGMLEKEKCDVSTKSLNFPGRRLKSKLKEVRKRSLYELTNRGNDSSCTDFSTMKISRCISQTKCGSNFSEKGNGDGNSSRLCFKSIEEHHQYPAVLDLDSFCCVCKSSNKDEINCLLECNRCLIRVHQACYGVPNLPKTHWYCRPCRTSSKNIVCVLCGYGGGAMTRALRSRNIVKSLLKARKFLAESRPNDSSLENQLHIYSPSGSELGTNSFPIIRPAEIHSSPASLWKNDLQGQLDAVKIESYSPNDLMVQNSITAGVLDATVKQWIHMVCGLWTPGTRCPNVDTMSAFDVSGASCPKGNVVCSICNQSGGSFIQCRVVDCFTRFHPWCAHQKGLLQSEVEGVDNENVGFYGRCELHAAYHQSSVCHIDTIDTKTFHSAEHELTCARTEGYKGRRREGFRHNLPSQSNDSGKCLVSQEQLDAWLHINGQKPFAKGPLKLQSSDIESDRRKEFVRYKQSKGWKNFVVYKSGIHALGLYTSQFISRGAMVVEYVGEVIGLRVADKRESEYQSGRGLQYKSACYFFRVDKEHIIDATRKGGIARFVNHSCLPNCVAKVISVRNEKKVVFFAERDICPGEEITYDYHFNHEDEGKKIPCFCNSKNCRRYLN